MYYLCRENIGADQLRSYRAADLRLCFRICKKWFSNDAAHIISVNLEREKEDSIKGTSNTLPPTKPNHFPVIGVSDQVQPKPGCTVTEDG